MSANPHDEVLKHHFDNLEQQHSAERLGMWFFLVTEVLFFSGLFVAYTVYRYWFPAEFAFGSSHLILWIASVNTGLLISSSLTMTLAIRSAQLGHRRALIRHLLATALLGTAFMGLKAFEYYTDFHERFVPGEIFQSEYAKAINELKAEQERLREITGDRDRVLTPAEVADFEFRSHPQHWAEELARTNFTKKPGDVGYLSPQRIQLFLVFYYVMTGIHGIHIIVGIGCILWLVQQALTGRIPPENYSTVEVVSLYWHLVDMIWLFLMPLLYLAGAGLHAAGH